MGSVTLSHAEYLTLTTIYLAERKFRVGSRRRQPAAIGKSEARPHRAGSGQEPTPGTQNSRPESGRSTHVVMATSLRFRSDGRRLWQAHELPVRISQDRPPRSMVPRMAMPSDFFTRIVAGESHGDTGVSPQFVECFEESLERAWRGRCYARRNFLHRSIPSAIGPGRGNHTQA